MTPSSPRLSSGWSGRRPSSWRSLSDVVDIYHVNDAMRARGWRFNGLQYPNALHLAVTRPQTQDGVVERFAADLREAVAYARDQRRSARRPAALYGGLPGGMTADASVFITAVMRQPARRPAERPGSAMSHAVGIGSRSSSTSAPAAPRSGSRPSTDGCSGASTERCRPTGDSTGRATQDAGRGGTPWSTWPAPDWGPGGCCRPGRGRRRHRSMGQHPVPVAADGTPTGPCRLFLDTRGRHTPGSDRWSALAITRRGSPRGSAAPAALPHPTAATRSPTSRHPARRPRRGPGVELVHGAGGLPDDAVHGPGAASPNSMTLAWLTDNRTPERLEYDPPRPAGRSRPGQAATACPHRDGRRPGPGRGGGPVRPLPRRAGHRRDHGPAHRHGRVGRCSTTWDTSRCPRRRGISAPVATKKTDVLRSVATVPACGRTGTSSPTTTRSPAWR